ncbi:tannase and feruloyl esterase [Pleomassaria siparia CBS 279.74]|uniref:Carboxylic ester hydrolase n=1 Tax=Pleomassaria siparia CBS 279.74 TaxID=1314801 RepID=A0A6G1KJ55_9PLEO|nr:tannase and feruloyl esterase [Pleomassaria siparia CBS 279.74]
MKFNQHIWLPLFQAYSAFAYSEQVRFAMDNFKSTCSYIGPKLAIENATVYLSFFLAAGTNLSLSENDVTCDKLHQVVSVDLCRISLYVSTSNRSGINMEAWLPAKWTGRLMSLGNPGLSGCIPYDGLAYTANLGFATVSANNGHNGTSGEAFYNNADVLEDFAYRARRVHTGVVVGKQISQTFYGKAHKKSYYLGCSTGGRQAGAPAFAFNNLTSMSGHFYTLTGPVNSSTYLPPSLWAVVHEDILSKCDMLDNYVNRILEDPSLCNYASQSLICTGSSNSSACLTPVQSATVDGAFQPVYAADGSLVYPRMQPGSEILASARIYSGKPFSYTVDWFRYAIYSDPTWDSAILNETDYANAARINPFNIETWKGDLSAVRDRGAKILHYHGLMDEVISSDNSPRYYQHVSSTMNLASAELDDFYRFFRISGMAHCSGGDGASVIGQTIASVDSLEPQKNVLMAIVDWVENGVAPETIIGSKWANGTKSSGIEYERAHCKYPKRNVYKGEGDPKAIDSWKCID